MGKGMHKEFILSKAFLEKQKSDLRIIKYEPIPWDVSPCSERRELIGFPKSLNASECQLLHL